MLLRKATNGCKTLLECCSDNDDVCERCKQIIICEECYNIIQPFEDDDLYKIFVLMNVQNNILISVLIIFLINKIIFKDNYENWRIK